VGDNTYLDAAMIKENELGTGLTARVDLATLSRVIFTPTLDLKRVQRGVEDFTQLFLVKKGPKVKASQQKALQETHAQLVAIVSVSLVLLPETGGRRDI